MSERDPRDAGPGAGGGDETPGRGGGGQPSEEELRKVTVRDVLLQTVVSLVNLSGQRLGLTPDTRDMLDLEQARLGIEAVRQLLPLLEQQDADQVRPVREALAQLQMAYAQEAGAAGQVPASQGAGQPGGAEGATPGGAAEPGGGPEQTPGGAETRRSSGRLWVPPGSGD